MTDRPTDIVIRNWKHTPSPPQHLFHKIFIRILILWYLVIKDSLPFQWERFKCFFVDTMALNKSNPGRHSYYMCTYFDIIFKSEAFL